MEVLLLDPELAETAVEYPRDVIRAAVRAAVAATRKHLLAAMPDDADQAQLQRAVVARALGELRVAREPHYRKAINATGVILHTGLGRAVLPPAALRHIAEDLSGYSLLQVDLETGRRGSRRHADPVAAAAAHRRRGRDGREQQRGGHLDRAQHDRGAGGR